MRIRSALPAFVLAGFLTSGGFAQTLDNGKAPGDGPGSSFPGDPLAAPARAADPAPSKAATRKSQATRKQSRSTRSSAAAHSTRQRTRPMILLDPPSQVSSLPGDGATGFVNPPQGYVVSGGGGFGNFANYGGGGWAYLAAATGFGSTGFPAPNWPTATAAAPLGAGPTDTKFIHGFDGDGVDEIRPRVDGSEITHQRIERVARGTYIPGYGVAIRKGEQVNGGNYIPGYGVVGSAGLPGFSGYATGSQVNGGTYVPGFGVTGGAGTNYYGATGTSYGNPAAASVNGGNYVPGFGVTGGHTLAPGFGVGSGSGFGANSGGIPASFGAPAGGAVAGGTYTPGFGVHK